MGTYFSFSSFGGADYLILTTSFVPLPKSATLERIHSNARLYDFCLDPDDMTKLDSLDKGKEGAVSWNPVDFP
jgi:diketogulonate reductase-like aldo/keto reductase